MARFLHDRRHNDSRLEAAELRITTQSDKICNARFSSQTMPKPKIPPTGRRMRVQSVQRTLREMPCSKLQRKDNLNNKTRARINHISLCTLCAFLCIYINDYKNTEPLKLRPTCFGFRGMRIDGVGVVYFRFTYLLSKNTLRGETVSVSLYSKSEVMVDMCNCKCYSKDLNLIIYTMDRIFNLPEFKFQSFARFHQPSFKETKRRI